MTRGERDETSECEWEWDERVCGTGEGASETVEKKDVTSSDVRDE